MATVLPRIGIADIEEARERIAARVRRTPILSLTQLKSPMAFDAAVTLKLECLQVTGSFKARGAMNKLIATPRSEISGGIVTASGGNHGLGVARTAHVAGVAATIFVPENVSPAKVAKMERWGATVKIGGSEWSETNGAAVAFAEAHGAAYFHPFADPLVVAGQGTLALEVLEQVSDFDTVVVAIGGGGLMSGFATALKARTPDVRIVGVEPVGSPTLKCCLDAGKVVDVPEVTSTVATLTCRRTEPWVFETVRRTVNEIVLVSDDDMAEAAQFLWFETGIAADPSGAAAVAALRSHPRIAAGARHVLALVCGAGADGT